MLSSTTVCVCTIRRCVSLVRLWRIFVFRYFCIRYISTDYATRSLISHQNAHVSSPLCKRMPSQMNPDFSALHRLTSTSCCFIIRLKLPSHLDHLRFEKMSDGHRPLCTKGFQLLETHQSVSQSLSVCTTLRVSPSRAPSDGISTLATLCVTVSNLEHALALLYPQSFIFCSPFHQLTQLSGPQPIPTRPSRRKKDWGTHPSTATAVVTHYYASWVNPILDHRGRRKVSDCQTHNCSSQPVTASTTSTGEVSKRLDILHITAQCTPCPCCISIPQLTGPIRRFSQKFRPHKPLKRS